MYHGSLHDLFHAKYATAEATTTVDYGAGKVTLQGSMATDADDADVVALAAAQTEPVPYSGPKLMTGCGAKRRTRQPLKPAKCAAMLAEYTGCEPPAKPAKPARKARQSRARNAERNGHATATETAIS